MKKQTDDPYAPCRADLARYARGLARAPVACRQEMIRRALAVAMPESVRLLAEALVGLLGTAGAGPGAAAALAELGPVVWPVLERALVVRSDESRLVRLAHVAVALGPHLSAGERTGVQTKLLIAAGRAPAARAALDEAAWRLRDLADAEPAPDLAPGAV